VRTGGDHYRHPSVGNRNRAGVGPASSAADPAGGMGRPRWPIADHRWHGDPVARRSPTQRWRSEASVVVVVPSERLRNRYRPLLAGVLAALRHRAHFSTVQTDPWLNRSQAAQPGSGRPLDLASDRLPHPTETGPAPSRRPAPPLGETNSPRAAHTRACPARISEPPREDPFSSRSTKTLPAWPRAATGLEEPPPRYTP
jgi:hypothetical protein